MQYNLKNNVELTFHKEQADLLIDVTIDHNYRYTIITSMKRFLMFCKNLEDFSIEEPELIKDDVSPEFTLNTCKDGNFEFLFSGEDMLTKAKRTFIGHIDLASIVTFKYSLIDFAKKIKVSGGM